METTAASQLPRLLAGFRGLRVAALDRGAAAAHRRALPRSGSRRSLRGVVACIMLATMILVRR